MNTTYVFRLLLQELRFSLPRWAGYTLVTVVVITQEEVWI